MALAAVLVSGSVRTDLPTRAPAAAVGVQPHSIVTPPSGSPAGGSPQTPSTPASPAPTGSPRASAAPASLVHAAALIRASPFSGPATVTCVNVAAVDTSRLTNAIAAAPQGGLLTIGPGTCALNNNLPLHSPITIEGSGQQATFIVQHAAANVFQVNSPHVTVEDLSLDTATYNSGSYPQGTGGSPAVLWSAQSYTSVINVTAASGDGFGMRITGPNPCDTDQTVGTIVRNLTISNAGTGGRASLDIDCTNGAALSGITIPRGNYIALYQDENVSLEGVRYTPNSEPCQAPVYVTGKAVNILIAAIVGGGHVIQNYPPLINITVINDVVAAGC